MRRAVAATILAGLLVFLASWSGFATEFASIRRLLELSNTVSGLLIGSLMNS